ncbi:MAG: hypothetical protein DIU55_008440 [Bacillota bacterium]|nr:MAG: hypothetical protein DIU55_09855 [Bacillota bacterium]
MVFTVIGLTLLGVALLLPVGLAFRLSFATAAEREAARAEVRAAAHRSGRTAPRRVRLRLPAPRLVRRFYLWKALSPLVFALTVMFGIAVGGKAGYVLMGLGLINLLLGLWGWDDYVPGHTGNR